MSESPGLASASLRRSLTISGVVAAVTLLGIPLNAARAIWAARGLPRPA
jgi:hypothetical protein